MSGLGAQRLGRDRNVTSWLLPSLLSSNNP